MNVALIMRTQLVLGAPQTEPQMTAAVAAVSAVGLIVHAGRSEDRARRELTHEPAGR